MNSLPSHTMNLRTGSLKDSKLDLSKQNRPTFLKRAFDLARNRQVYLLDNGYVYETNYQCFSELTKAISHTFSIWKMSLQLNKRGYEFRFYMEGCVSFLIELRISILVGAGIFRQYLMRPSINQKFKIRRIQNKAVASDLDC